MPAVQGAVNERGRWRVRRLSRPISPLRYRKLGDITIRNQVRNGSIASTECIAGEFRLSSNFDRLVTSLLVRNASWH
jgi:hypothetical protein